MIEPILAAVIPVLFTAGLGFAWVRCGRPFDNAAFTPLVVEVGTPALILATFARTSIPSASFAAMALASVASLICFALAAGIALSCLRLPKRTFLPALSFPNNGNLGLPLSLYAWGQEGLGYAIVFYAICMVAQFTAGQAVAAGMTNWRGVLRMPLVYAVALGVGISVWHLVLPRWIVSAVTLVGGVTVPLMLLMLGASLARLRVNAIGRAGLLSGLRIGLGASIGFVIALVFGLDGDARAVLILQSAMPPAVYNYLFAQRWNNQPEEVASVVVVSTLASIVTIPALLHFLIK